MQNVSNGSGMGVGGLGGGDGLASSSQIQQLQGLTGMSSKGVEQLVSEYAQQNGTSESEAANDLISQFQNMSVQGNQNSQGSQDDRGGQGQKGQGQGGQGPQAGQEGQVAQGLGTAAAGTQVGEDKNRNGIPDIVEKLLAEGKISPEEAKSMLQSMGVPEDKIQRFLGSVDSSATGTDANGGLDYNSNMSPMHY